MTKFNLLYQSPECSERKRKDGTSQRERFDNLIEVNSLETFKEAVLHVNTMGMYKDQYRCGKNWRGSNVLFADIDGGATIEEFTKDFKEYEFYIATSKSHMKDKDGMGAHPRFHIYFPIEFTTDKKTFHKALVKLSEAKLYFDISVKDLGRYFEKTVDTCEVYHNDGASILNYLFSIPDTPKFKKALKEAKEFINGFNPEEVYQYFKHKGIIRTYEGYYDVIRKKWIDERFLLHWTKELKMIPSNEDQKKEVSIGEFWINKERDNPENPVFSSIEFRPDLKYGENYEKENIIFNTFEGFQKIEGFEGNIQPILNHIKEVICDNDDAVYAYVIKWLAHMFQKPYEKPRVALGVRGERQIGKGLIFDNLLKNILEDYEFITTDLSCVEKNVNNNIEIRDKLLLYFNEVGWLDDKNDIGKINALITDRTLKYRELYHTPFEGRSFHRVVITTNADRIVEHKDTSVRWLLMTASPKYKGNTEYFNNLLECINTCYGSFLNYLLSIDLDGWDFNAIPITETALEQQELSLNSAERFCMEAKEGSYIPMLNEIEENEDGIFKSSYLYAMYDLYCKNNGYKPFSSNNFGIYLKKYFERIRKRDGSYYLVKMWQRGSGSSSFEKSNENEEEGDNFEILSKNPSATATSATKTNNIIKFKKEPDQTLIKQMEKDLRGGGDINEEAKLFISGKIPNIECWKHDNTPKAVGSLKAHGYSREQVEDIFGRYTPHILSLALLIYDTDYEAYKTNNG